MQPIENVGQVMQVLRRQMAENLQRMRSNGGRPVTQGAMPRAAAPLRQTVARRIKAIDADDPRYREKVAELFVESVLLAEFGEQLVNEPEFRDLVRQVQSALLADTDLQASLARLAVQMRAT
jgi:hypothetical protein